MSLFTPTITRTDKKVEKNSLRSFEKELNKLTGFEGLKNKRSRVTLENTYKVEFEKACRKGGNEHKLSGFMHAADNASTLLKTSYSSDEAKFKVFGFLAGSLMGGIESALKYRSHYDILFSNAEYAQFEHVIRAFKHFEHHSPTHFIVEEIHKLLGSDRISDKQRPQLRKLGEIAVGKFSF